MVKVIWQKAASPPHTNHSIVCSRKTFLLNGFNIKRFAHPYFLGVLFFRMRCHWLKRDAEALSQSHAAVTCILMLEKLENGVLNRWFLINANVELCLYIAEGNSFPSVYCANVSVQLTVMMYGTDTSSKVPFPLSRGGISTPIYTQFLVSTESSDSKTIQTTVKDTFFNIAFDLTG